MRKLALAILIATTPAVAANDVVSRHEVQFQGETFICGQINVGGKIRHYIHSIPQAKYIPEYEPSASDPLARSWLITYRIICEGGSMRPNLTARLNRRRF